MTAVYPSLASVVTAALATAWGSASVPGSSWWTVEGSTPLLAVIVVAGAGTGVLFAVSLVAYGRRGGRRFLLVSVAIGALWARSIVGAGTVLGYVPMPAHHYLEHTLDFVIAGLVLYAVYAHAPGDVSEPDDADR